MLVSVDFAPEIEKPLTLLAVRRGISLDACIQEIVRNAVLAVPSDNSDESELEQRRNLQTQINAPTIALLRQSRHEDEVALQAMSPAEQAQEEADVEAFLAALNRTLLN